MRLFLAPLFLLCVPGPAQADQYDPRLDELFDQLRAGDGDPKTLQNDIESSWLAPPEAGIAVLAERAIIALEAADAATAGVLVSHINGLAPSYAEGWVMKGHLALIEEDRIAAELAFEKAVALEPRHYMALVELGDLAAMNGDKERAHEKYRAALDLNPYLDDVRERADRLRRELGAQEI